MTSHKTEPEYIEDDFYDPFDNNKLPRYVKIKDLQTDDVSFEILDVRPTVSDYKGDRIDRWEITISFIDVDGDTAVKRIELARGGKRDPRMEDLMEAIKAGKRLPKYRIEGSSAGYYFVRADAPID